MSLLSNWSLLFRLFYVYSRDVSKEKKNWSHQKIALVKVNIRYSGIHWVCKFLSMFYLKI